MAFPSWSLPLWFVVFLLVIVAAQALTIAVLLWRQRRNVEQEQTVRMQRRELAHLSRVATVGELSGALAHELNQPLTAILSNAQAAQHYLDESPLDLGELRAILADIVDADKRAAAVIDRVRTLLKKQETDAVPVKVNDVVRETIELAHTEFATRHVSVRTSLTPLRAVVLGDRVQLQQVILNLMLNACDAMEHTRADDRQMLISTVVEASGSVRVEVTDRGVGIPAHDVDRVFEPFVSSKRQGLGLGLAICRSIVTAHGGQLWAANNAETGATFSVRLPGRAAK